MILPMICREFYKSGYGIMYSANGWVYIWGYKGLFWGANWGTWGMINGISFKGEWGTDTIIVIVNSIISLDIVVISFNSCILFSSLVSIIHTV